MCTEAYLLGLHPCPLDNTSYNYTEQFNGHPGLGTQRHGSVQPFTVALSFHVSQMRTLRVRQSASLTQGHATGSRTVGVQIHTAAFHDSPLEWV